MTTRSTRKPVGKPDNQDLFDLDAAIAEAVTDIETREFEFTYRSRKWKFRPAAEADAKLLGNTDLSDVQQVMAYIRDLLGEEQWEDFPRISLAAALQLVEAFSEFTQGVGTGESEASSDS